MAPLELEPASIPALERFDSKLGSELIARDKDVATAKQASEPVIGQRIVFLPRAER